MARAWWSQVLAVSVVALTSCTGTGGTSPSATKVPGPEDHLVPISDPRAFLKAIAPAVQQARDSYPQARRRFLDGLPEGQTLYVTTRLHNRTGEFEQVFVAVKTIENGIFVGRIASEIQAATGYRLGQEYRFPETELVDWTITHMDGTEEGNFVGKLLDEQQGIHH